MSSHKVKLTGPGGKIVFEASSLLGESRSASYDGFSIVHLPTSLLAYRNTSGRKFDLQGKFVSRTKDEASENSKYLDLIRKWILPDFGGTGATPPILKLSGYKNNNIKDLQVILHSYSWQFPEEVDFIWAGSSPMPVIGTIQVALEEVYSAEQITAKEWEIKVGGGGSFKRQSEGPGGSSGGGIGSGGASGGSSGGGTSGGGSGGFSSFDNGPTGFGNLGSALELVNNPLSFASDLLDSFTRNSGTDLLNSFEISEDSSRLSPFSNNSFISGAGVQQPSGSTLTAEQRQELLVPSFDRTPSPPTAPPIDPD